MLSSIQASNLTIGSSMTSTRPSTRQNSESVTCRCTLPELRSSYQRWVYSGWYHSPPKGEIKRSAYEKCSGRRRPGSFYGCRGILSNWRPWRLSSRYRLVTTEPSGGLIHLHSGSNCIGGTSFCHASPCF